LPSASILINMFNILTGFTYRGLSPHKFTPVPGVHKQFQPTKRLNCLFRATASRGIAALTTSAIEPVEKV
jgi:hypothetical protein